MKSFENPVKFRMIQALSFRFSTTTLTATMARLAPMDSVWFLSDKFCVYTFDFETVERSKIYVIYGNTKLFEGGLMRCSLQESSKVKQHAYHVHVSQLGLSFASRFVQNSSD